MYCLCSVALCESTSSNASEGVRSKVRRSRDPSSLTQLDLHPAASSPELSSPTTPSDPFSLPIAPAAAATATTGSEEAICRECDNRPASVSASTSMEREAARADDVDPNKPDVDDRVAPQAPGLQQQQQPPAKPTAEETACSRHPVSLSTLSVSPIVSTSAPGTRASIASFISSLIYGESRIFPLPLCVFSLKVL